MVPLHAMAVCRQLACPRRRAAGSLRWAALLVALLVALLAGFTAAGCGTAATAASGSKASPSMRALRVSTSGTEAVLLRASGTARFVFRFLGSAPATWTWRVVGYYGAQTASGSGQTPSPGATGSVSWDGLASDGTRADPGLYLVQVGPRGGAAAAMTTIGLVRYQPPVEAHVYRRLPGAGRRVALTFDDGGGRTAWYWILRDLRDAHAKGTFFPIGLYVGDYAKRMAGLTLRDHMAIGSHSWSHPDLTKLSTAQVRFQLQQVESIWWHDFRASPVPYLRPPYGAYDARTLAIAGELGYSRIILWDVDSNDWTNPGVKVIVRNVLDHVRPGSIVLMHTRGRTPAALPAIIAGLQARHYKLVTVPELFRAAGYR